MDSESWSLSDAYIVDNKNCPVYRLDFRIFQERKKYFLVWRLRTEMEILLS